MRLTYNEEGLTKKFPFRNCDNAVIEDVEGEGGKESQGKIDGSRGDGGQSQTRGMERASLWGGSSGGVVGKYGDCTQQIGVSSFLPIGS